MIFYKRQQPIDPETAIGKVVYLWLGKTKWLPYIGPAYLVVSSRKDHIVCVAVREDDDRTGPRMYIHRMEVALSCDPYEEYPAIQEMKAEYTRSRSELDRYFAKSLKAMSTEDVQHKASVRRRTRPKGGLFYIKPKKKYTSK